MRLGCVGLKAPNMFTPRSTVKVAGHKQTGGEKGKAMLTKQTAQPPVGSEREVPCISPLLYFTTVPPFSCYTMSVATQAMPHPPVLDGDANGVAGKGADGANGVPKEPKFASGLILPPPEIKCEPGLALSPRRNC